MAGYRGTIRKRRIRNEWNTLQRERKREQQRRYEARLFMGTDTMQRRIQAVSNSLYRWCGAIDEQTRAKIRHVTDHG